MWLRLRVTQLSDSFRRYHPLLRCRLLLGKWGLGCANACVPGKWTLWSFTWSSKRALLPLTNSCLAQLVISKWPSEILLKV